MPSPTWMTAPRSFTSTRWSKPLIFSLMIVVISSALICMRLLLRQKGLHRGEAAPHAAVDHGASDADLDAGDHLGVGPEFQFHVLPEELGQAAAQRVRFGGVEGAGRGDGHLPGAARLVGQDAEGVGDLREQTDAVLPDELSEETVDDL